jgi:ATP-dependent protease ClpP protease subunit
MKTILSFFVLVFILSTVKAKAASISFSGPINPKTIQSLSEKIQRLILNNDRDIVLTLESKGGEVPSAVTLAKMLTDLKKSGHRIVTFNRSVCYSACTIIFSAGDVRMATPQAKFYFHSIGVKGAGKNWKEVQRYWADIWLDQIRIVDFRLAFDLENDKILLGRGKERYLTGGELFRSGFSYVNSLNR